MMIKSQKERYNLFISAIDKMYTKADELGADKIGIGEKFVDWLYENGYFNAPASTKYHGNYEGGLFDHSLAVTRQLVLMEENLHLKWQRPQSPWIVGLFHDLCKIDEYVKVVDKEGQVMMGTGEVKGEESHFEYVADVLLKGHGDKSIILLSQFMTLTEEEILCIRYHMGAYNRDDWNGYDKAIRKYPNVLFTHTADMYVSKVLGL
jgi:HD superfamily phosphohydrolase YqeK